MKTHSMDFALVLYIGARAYWFGVTFILPTEILIIPVFIFVKHRSAVKALWVQVKFKRVIPEAARVSRCVTILISVDNVNVAQYFTKTLLNTTHYPAVPPFIIVSLQRLITRTTESMKEERDYG